MPLRGLFVGMRQRKHLTFTEMRSTDRQADRQPRAAESARYRDALQPIDVEGRGDAERRGHLDPPARTPTHRRGEVDPTPDVPRNTLPQFLPNRVRGLGASSIGIVRA